MSDKSGRYTDLTNNLKGWNNDLQTTGHCIVYEGSAWCRHQTKEKRRKLL